MTSQQGICTLKGILTPPFLVELLLLCKEHIGMCKHAHPWICCPEAGAHLIQSNLHARLCADRWILRSLLHQPAQHYICIESLTFQLGVGIRDPCQILFGELWQGEAQTTWLGIPLQLQRCMGERLLNAGPSKVPFPHQNFQRGSEQVTPTAQVKGMKKIDRQHLDAKTSAQCQLRSTLPWKGCPLSATPGSVIIHIGVGVSSNHWCPWTPHSASKPGSWAADRKEKKDMYIISFTYNIYYILVLLQEFEKWIKGTAQYRAIFLVPMS